MFSHVTKKTELKNAPLVFFLHAFNAMSLLVVSSLLGFLLSEVNSAAVSLYSCAGEQALTSCIVAPPAYFSCVFQWKKSIKNENKKETYPVTMKYDNIALK